MDESYNISSNYTVEEVKEMMFEGKVITCIFEGPGLTMYCGCATQYFSNGLEDITWDDGSPAFIMAMGKEVEGASQVNIGIFVGAVNGAWMINA